MLKRRNTIKMNEDDPDEEEQKKASPSPFQNK